MGNGCNVDFAEVDRRFADALGDWQTAHPDEFECLGSPAWDNPHHPGRSAAILAAARHDAIQFDVSLNRVIERLESPIGYVMLLALLWNASTVMSWTVTFDESCDRWPWSELLRIEPQAQLGDYRVDPLLSLTDYDIRTMRLTKESLTRQSVSLVVECDGHDFHEKTKEQAQHDKERDRALQSAGFPVFRFTGSERWKNPAKCAEEACGDLDRRLRSRKEETWRAKGIHPDQIGRV